MFQIIISLFLECCQSKFSPSEPLVTFPLPLPQLVNAGLGVAELGRPRDVSQAVLELIQLPQRR